VSMVQSFDGLAPAFTCERRPVACADRLLQARVEPKPLRGGGFGADVISRGGAAHRS
jgi:hypothetical protein